MPLALAIVALLGAAIPPPGSRAGPPEIRHLLEARAGLQTGRVVWSTICHEQTRSDINYLWHSRELPRFFVTTFCSDALMIEDLGDSSGVLFRNAEGEPHPELGRQVQRYLSAEGRQWECRDLALSARVDEGRSDLPDVRALGLATSLGQGLSLERALAHLLDDPDCQRVRVGNLIQLTVSRDWEYRMLLDPQKDWNPVRLTILRDGETLYDVHTTLERYGDAWFPKRVELFDAKHENGQTPTYEIEVLSAEFNQPDHPQQLTPESIGVSVGTNVHLFRGNGPPRPVGDFGWTGSELIPYHELQEKVTAGQLKLDPYYKLAVRRSDALALELDGLEEEWAASARRHIERYALNDEQVEQVWRVWRAACDRAQSHLSRHRDEIQQIRAAVCDSSVSSSQPSAQLERLSRRMADIVAGLWRIRLGQFEPELDKIPTRAQRQAAAEREVPTSLPAGVHSRRERTP